MGLRKSEVIVLRWRPRKKVREKMKFLAHKSFLSVDRNVLLLKMIHVRHSNSILTPRLVPLTRSPKR